MANKDPYQEWIGRTQQRQDTITAAPLAGLAATLDHCVTEYVPGTPIASLAHWLYFLPRAPLHEIGIDGHEVRGGFLPPVPLPRRMWAGGRLHFDRPLSTGDEAVRRSTITAVEAKKGRSGPLVFVTLLHKISNAGGLALREEQEIVYRDNPQPGAAAPAPIAAPTNEDFRREISPDPVMLFRYSALTFNSHRIHYDRNYASKIEGYPGLVVHGPLIATLMIDLLQRELPDAALTQFHFKAVSPLFDIHPFTVCGKREADGSVAMWARNSLGHLAMRAGAVIE